MNLVLIKKCYGRTTDSVTADDQTATSESMEAQRLGTEHMHAIEALALRNIELATNSHLLAKTLLL